jgi:hypothetical protein
MHYMYMNFKSWACNIFRAWSLTHEHLMLTMTARHSPLLQLIFKYSVFDASKCQYFCSLWFYEINFWQHKTFLLNSNQNINIQKDFVFSVIFLIHFQQFNKHSINGKLQFPTLTLEITFGFKFFDFLLNLTNGISFYHISTT